MKLNRINVVAIVAALLVVATAGTAQAGAKTCSNATLQGTYAAVLTGVAGNAPFASLDAVTADGAGNASGSGTSNVNGSVSTVSISFTYTINADCTGTAMFSTGSTQALIVKLDGSEVHILSTSSVPGTVISGTAHRLN
jgi:hypothetical protein